MPDNGRPTSRHSRTALGLAVAALATVFAALLVGPAPASAAVSPHSARADIARIAKYQTTVGSRNREHGGDNCNWYSTRLHVGPTGQCGNGWRSEAWCADFVKYVYKDAGVATSGLNPLAASGHTYGQKHGTWHTSHPKVGDLAVLSSHEHIGIVTSVGSGGNFTMVSGNTWNPQHTSINAVKATGYTVGQMWGFASPA
ncbi:MAG: CHAP domain-containing protein [Actinocatenispora sp.]